MKTYPWEPPTHSIWYCAAIATAVAGVAAAGTSLYSSYSQGQATKKAQGTVGSNAAGLYGTKVEPVKYKDNVNLPNFNPGSGVDDYSNNLPMLNSIAMRVTDQAQAERDKLTGGQSSANLRDSGADINSLLHGTVTNAQQDRVGQLVAERSGGAFSPAGQAGQIASNDYARSIGTTAYNAMQSGLSFAPQWESMVDAFTYKPQQAANDALQALRARNDYTTTAAGIQLQRDQNAYLGAVNYNKTVAGADPQVAGAFNDNLALSSIGAKQDQNTANALLGTVKAAAGAYSTIKGSSSGDGLNDAGFYTSAASASAAAQGAPISTYYGTGSTTPQYYISG